MSIPSFQTDNLYKFVALFGLALTVLGAFYLFTLMADHNKALLTSKYAMERHDFISDRILKQLELMSEADTLSDRDFDYLDELRDEIIEESNLTRDTTVQSTITATIYHDNKIYAYILLLLGISLMC